ncbi:MAG: hypothetical protein DI628_08200 [Blastochloris viridis]|uniref:Uncharacterized protein n=1 Tax=Blastochloris viridis TaxID=1079 RepID=A0A6N4R0D6_BLAVI|nr:MAG: hypothetical protein DI628_08200 [Blastochloris viridis]
MMKPQAPRLPEATFQALSNAKLEAMIDIALSHPQETSTPRSGKVIAFPQHRTFFQNMAYSGGLATMAASIVLAFVLMPDSTTTAVTASLDTSSSADVSDMLLYDTFGA